MEERKIRKRVVVIGLICLVMGIVLVVFSIEESHAEENTLGRWENIWLSTLNPHDQAGPSWSVEMQKGSFFELNVSASGTLRTMIGNATYNNYTNEEVLVNVIFDQSGTHFDQKVVVGEDGFYTMEIKNEGTTPVNIWGNVLTKRIATSHETVHPYSSLGTPAILAGLTSLIYGGLTNSKKGTRRSSHSAP